MTVSGSHLVLPLANHPFRYLDATAVAQALGDAKCGGLPAFRALTGCDVTSPFAGNGKRTAWTAWDANDDATLAMCTLPRMPTTESVMNVLPIIKRSIVIMYDRGSSESSVNGERLVLFTSTSQGNRKHPANIRCTATSPACVESRVRGRPYVGPSND